MSAIMLVDDGNTTESAAVVKRLDFERRAYLDLARFIRFLASVNQIRDHWSLNMDDLTGEGFYALAVAIKRYGDRPYNKFLVIAKACIRNRLVDVKRRALISGRREELTAPSLDDDGFDVPSDENNPENWVESAELMEWLWDNLTGIERKVLNALLGGEERVLMYLQLSRDRREWVFKSPAVSVDSWVVARAICEPLDAVNSAIDHIKCLLGHPYS